MRQLAGWFFRALGALIAFLPTRLRLFIGDGVGFLWFDVFRIRRSVAVENVKLSFPELSHERHVQIARRSLSSMGRTLTEYALFPYLNKENINHHYTFEGEDNLRRALDGGKGMILLTLHLGNGDFASAALALRGWPIHLISKEFKSRWLNDLWFGMRGRLGTKFISPEKSSFDILRALKKNEGVVFVLDQFMGPPIGVRTTFFGRETGTAQGCALIAVRTGAPVIPGYSYRLPDGTHRAVFEAPIPTPKILDDSLRDENIAALTQTYTDKIEEIVRRYPEQWMWIHRRWKEFRD